MTVITNNSNNSTIIIKQHKRGIYKLGIREYGTINFNWKSLEIFDRKSF